MRQCTMLICLVLVFGLGAAAKLPAHFKTCQRTNPDFNQCLTKAVEEAINSLTQPNKELGIPSLEPLLIPTLTIGAGTGAVAVQQNYKNFKVVNYSKAKVRSFTVDFDKKTATIECFYDELQFVADYDIKGKILLLPVFGKGKSTFVFSKLNMTNTFKFEEYEKKNNKYWKVTSSKMSTSPGSMVLNFENLFNGNKALSDNVNQVVNDNWKEVYFDVNTGYEEALAQVNMQIFNSVLSKVPITELFGSA